ncbi:MULTISPECIES: precorrin-3B C(17)-methyltransferase [unclassified Coleofasciculus]|uniref:precorrin-3B C(17)-methyltransferase n=1 Tax=unclassified Coleofasciculus TaxID=2692782 RepID=UPI00187E2986|nr:MULTISPECIES: precorrin-3B C(17)-methyltransferase [unclassified Coleofasciculus]MBE9128520.1 precorrin-3B C(17)-methyltransferase [Coleofasciculus sp. LEGE 07081]MBE9151276.1 precorrin-3B C(17)-methyltransferase [Coleofasciculus sp. LEGE 07092]
MIVLWQEFQPIAAIATTPTAVQKLQPLCQTTGAILWVPESLNPLENVQVYPGSLKSHIASLWHNHRAFIFCLATGAVVRLIAPLLQDKSHDPAVIVIDEKGQFVISLCSGHQGKADQLTRLIAIQLGATPVLTGASNGLGLPAIDTFGIPFGWQRGEGDWTGVSAVVARSEPVQLIQEVGSTLWQQHLPQRHPFIFELGVTDVADTDNLIAEGKSCGHTNNPSPTKSVATPKARVWISFTHRRFSPDSDIPKVQWHPRVLWVGIGCERGTSRQLIETAIEQVCRRYHLAQGAIAGIATIDIKADEVGLLELCRDHNLPLRTFASEVLRSVTVPTPSAVVDQEVGTPSVAEAAALCASLLPSTPSYQVGVIQFPETSQGIDSLTGSPLLVPKQIFKSDNEPGAVTVAIALAEQDYTGRTGQLLLVGTGPGQLNQMTPAAQTAVSGADAIIGYSLYIDLISPILHSGQIIERLPITQERQRAQRAIELAQWGLTVAVVSSGDCGIYGMAGLVLEELKAQGWDGKTPGVQVFPGITALQSAASRVGAPLMHDFCAISLSDLLTPWEVIKKRLEAAAAADFVIALYNPRSRTRTEQLAIAHQIFLNYRPPHTPVAIVRSAYREDEQITLTNLDKLLSIPIDMLTTVLIGNQSTSLHGDWMITPRGYLVNE